MKNNQYTITLSTATIPAKKVYTFTAYGSTYQVILQFNKYSNGRIALVLVDAEDNDDVIAVASVNLPKVHLAPDEIVVKAYSENTGMDDWLATNGIAEYVDRVVPLMFTLAPVMRLLIPIPGITPGQVTPATPATN